MDKSFEIQRIYVKKEWYGAGFGKEMFTFALDQAKSRGFEWAWLGVWERNFKAQDFTIALDLNDLSEHQYITGDTVDTDWLLRKKFDLEGTRNFYSREGEAMTYLSQPRAGKHKMKGSKRGWMEI